MNSYSTYLTYTQVHIIQMIIILFILFTNPTFIIILQYLIINKHTIFIINIV